jgi:hypothetical protein
MRHIRLRESLGPTVEALSALWLNRFNSSSRTGKKGYSVNSRARKGFSIAGGNCGGVRLVGGRAPRALSLCVAEVAAAGAMRRVDQSGAVPRADPAIHARRVFTCGMTISQKRRGLKGEHRSTILDSEPRIRGFNYGAGRDPVGPAPGAKSAKNTFSLLATLSAPARDSYLFP